MTIKQMKASEVEAGMKVHFPNSRKAQEVVSIEKRKGLNEGEDRIVLIAGNAQWDCPASHDVNVEVEEPDGD